MAVEEIVRIIPPPASPTYTGDEESWRKFEAEMPFALPSDYRDYIKTYGYGDLGNMCFVLSPFFPIERENFLKQYKSVDADLVEHCEDEGWLSERRGSNPPGLVLFGYDTNGNYLHWLSIGDPEEWPVVIGGGRNWQVSRHEGPLTSFLAAVLSNKVERYSPNLIKKTFRVVP